MRRPLSLALLACLALLLAAFASADAQAQQQAQQQERRVALVIGNGAYKHAPPLPNPANDARLMAESLKAIGFELVGGKAYINVATKAELDQAVRRFGEMIRGGGVGLFFYAGHGVQVDGKNYLIPVGADVASKAQIKYELVDADYVLDEMNESSTKVNLVILDACRNNPFAGRGLRAVTPGLATVLAPKGTLIAYSTAPGKTAADGSGKNSPFTESLARQIRTSGQRIEDVFINVGVEVEQATGGAQSPWQSSSLRGIFCLSGTCGAQTATPTAPAAKPLDLKAEKQRVAEETARLKRERDELAQLQALQAEQARLEGERQKLEQAKQLALAQVPKEGPKQAPGAARREGSCRVVAYAPELAVLTGRLAVTGRMRDGKKLQALLLNLDEPVMDARGRFGGLEGCGKAVEVHSSDPSLQTRLSGLLRSRKNATITVSGTLTEHHDPARHFLPVIMDVKAITEGKAGPGDSSDAGAQQAPSLAAPAAQEQQEDMRSLLAQAEAGDIEACYQVASEYAARSKSSFKEAIFWGQKAALAGHVGAQSLVGVLYGMSDRQKAIVWTKLAADRGSVSAQSALSMHYLEVDKIQAAKWLILADRAGDRDAAFRLEWGPPNLSKKDKQKASELARAWKPVCPDNCKTFIIEKCGICPLTDEERWSVNAVNAPTIGSYLFGIN